MQARTLLSVALAVVLPAIALADTPKWPRLSWSTEDSSTTMAVTWNSDGGTSPSLVQYGPTPTLGQEASGTVFKANGDLGHVHEVELWDLTPDTTYYYRVGNDGGWSDVYSFRTGPLPGCRPIRFVALGDGRSQDSTGPAQQWPDIFAEALNEDPDLVINTGDIVHEGEDTTQWRNWLKETAPLLPGIPHMTSLGNHDNDKATGDTAAYNQTFQLPRNAATETEDFYWFRYGDAIFVSLSTATYGDGTKPYEVQAQWLDQVLTENPATWRFVFFHHPPYTSHAEAFGLEFNHGPDEVGQNASFIPVFDKHHVDVVFAGHNHFYERFAPMAGGGGSPTGNPVSDPSLGTVYVITGGAGAFTYDKVDLGFVEIDPMQDVVCAFPNQAPGSQVCSGKHHYMTITVDGGTLEANVIATTAQNFTQDPSNVEVIDTFTITKAAPTPTGCGVEPLPPEDGPDAGTADAGGWDAGATDDTGSGADTGDEADGGAHDDTVDPDAEDAAAPTVGENDAGALAGGGDEANGGAGGDPGDFGGGAGGGGLDDGDKGLGGGGAEPGMTPGDPGTTGGGGISPVPTPNVAGSGSGATGGGCGTTRGETGAAGLWALLLALLALRLARERRAPGVSTQLHIEGQRMPRGRWTRASRTILGLSGLLGLHASEGCSRTEEPPKPTTAPAQRRPAEPEGLVADEPPSPPQAEAKAKEVSPPEEPTRPTLPGTRVDITSLGGIQLAATWAPAAGDAPVLILLHRMQGDRQEWAPVASTLLDGVGASVLALDLRGHGESSRGPDGGALTWKDLRSDDWAALTADVRASVTWARMAVDDPAHPVILIGADISGSAALLYAGEDKAVAGVAVLSPGLSYHGVDPLAGAKALTGRPVLFLAGADDKYAVHSARVLSAESGARVEVIAGSAEHGVALLEHAPSAVQSLRTWLVETAGIAAPIDRANPPPR